MRIVGVVAAMAIALLASMGGASATPAVTFDLSGVTLAGASTGTLTGTFTVSGDLGTLEAADIIASANGSFVGYDYIYGGSGANSKGSYKPSSGLTLTSISGTYQMQIAFASKLSEAGATLYTQGSSFEHEAVTGAGNRSVSAGSVTPAGIPIPEPSSLPLMAVGLAAVAGMLAMTRSRRRSTRQA